MNTLLIYMVKVAVYLAAFYLVYSSMLSKDTTYGRNRAFLLLSLASALFFPLIAFQTIKPLDIQFFGKFLSEVFITASRNGNSDSVSALSMPGPLQVIYTIYIIGLAVSMFKFLIDFTNLLYLIAKKKNRGSRIIRFHGFNTAGFSALGYIFINTRLSPEEAGAIIKHEQNHLRQNHFLDIIFIEIVKTIQWFNPVVYLLNRDLRAIHEFQADHDCISSGVPVVSYQSLLLSQVFKSKAFNLTNSFSNPSLIKRRMIMMTKKPTSAIANMKLLLAVPVTAIVFLAISAYKEMPVSPEKQNGVNPMTEFSSVLTPDPSSKPSSSSPKQSASSLKASKNKSVPGSVKYEVAPPPPPPPPPAGYLIDKTNNELIDEDIPFVVVEQMPQFTGGPNELLRYIAQNTQYPESAKSNNVQGKVIIRFCVTAKGGVSQISVLKGVSPDLDSEAMRVVSTLPEFIPGKQGGVAVAVWYMVPIAFTLQ